MEHSTAASSNPVHGNHPMYKDHLSLQSNSTGVHQNPPLLHSNLHSFSMSQDGPLPQIHAGCNIEPFQREGCDALVSGCNGDASSSLHEPNLVHDNSNYETMRAHMPPDALAPLSHTSPEALLDVILIARKKLQQLQAVAELMVQVGGQAEQQQSLVAGVKSIMSQLSVATAGLCAQSAPCFKQNLGSVSQLNRGSTAQLNQALDLSFDEFCSNGMILPPLGSILRVQHEGCFPLSNTSFRAELTQSTMELVGSRSIGAAQPASLVSTELTRPAMELVCMRGLYASKPSGIKVPQLKEQGLNSSLGDPANHLRHGNTSNMLAESDISNESPSIVVETCDAHGTYGNRNQEMFGLEDHDYASVLRDDDDDDVEGENLPPGSYELVEMAAAEILAEHTHFCEICGKGFKRDANLRMHMRGHGDEYKTPAALARPDKCLRSPSMLRRYSCPYVGCKRNKKHRKFQPLKTILCVKNHYRRSHCPKLLICSKCKTKKFSVVADLKTHEKHCGQDKWQCSCGCTFSRKDKLVGHVSLFAGHTPAVPIHEMESLNEPLFSSLPTRDGEGLECLSSSEPSYLGLVESFRASSENGPRLITTMMAESDDGVGIPDLTIMGKEVLMSYKTGQQCPLAPVYPDEKSYLTENSDRGATEVMQHCG